MSTELSEHPYAETIWKLLKSYIGNDYGVAGLMGNLQAESGLYPNRVQGDVPYSDYSATYTEQVDNGTISESDFVNNAPNGGGYGLAQWTFYTRKQGLYDMWKDGGYSSIGSPELACAYLMYELENTYTTVYNALKNATDIRQASNIVLHDFESPADQSQEVEVSRAQLGQEIYNTFANGGGSITPTKPKKRKLSKLLLYAIATDDF